MTVTCDACQAESTLESAYFRVRRSGRTTYRLLCPACLYQYHSTVYKRLLIVLAVVGVALLAWFAVSGNPKDWFLMVPILGLIYPVVSTLLHEVGHAVGALLVGMRVFTVRVGMYGRRQVILRILGYDFVFRSIPFGGQTLVGVKSLAFARLRYFIVVLCGPLVHCLLILAALAMMDHWPRNQLLTSVMWILICCDAFMLLGSLWPMRQWSGQALTPNDGLRLLTLPWTSAAVLQQWHAQWFFLEGLEARERGRGDEARQWFERGLQAYPSDWSCKNGIGITDLDARRYDQARECFARLLDHSSLTPEMEAMSWNNLAWADLLAGTPALLAEADRLSQQAFDRLSWVPPVRGTRGSVLVELGVPSTGLELLERAFIENEDHKSKALNACFLALARARMGQPAEAQERLQQARRLDPKCSLLDRVQNELDGHGLPACVEAKPS